MIDRKTLESMISKAESFQCSGKMIEGDMEFAEKKIIEAHTVAMDFIPPKIGLYYGVIAREMIKNYDKIEISRLASLQTAILIAGLAISHYNKINSKKGEN